MLPHNILSAQLTTASFIYIFIFYTTQTIVYGFNLDLYKPTIYSGPSDSDFGYSVALTISDFRGSQVLIGAPRANTTTLLNNNVLNGGAVYRCPIDNNQNCQTLDIDNRPPVTTGQNTKSEPKYWGQVGEERSNQLLGASLVTSDDGTIAACAPHYINFGPRVNKREPTGDCWVSKDAGTRFTRVSPCLDRFTLFYLKTYKNESKDNGWASYHKTGHGMCGFSVALGPNNELGVGAPGNFYFHGELYSVSPRDDYRNYTSTGVGDQADDNSYLSWDIKYGEFDGDATSVDWAASAPRSYFLKGKVTIWSKKVVAGRSSMESLHNITGVQPGAYFGYSVAVGDFNGDDLDDVAVGAPLYANLAQDLIEIGRVSVYYQKVVAGRHQFPVSDSDMMTGKDRKGRFGLSMANVGDINLDGYDDLMVGAPYGGPNGNGVVYLYHGSDQGLDTTPIQVIHSEDVDTSSPLSTFGWAITGKMDVDGNRYTDVAVGAYKSNAAVLFKTRPLINIQGTIQSSKKTIKLPVPCSTGWDVETSQQLIEIPVEYCIRYDVRDMPSQISLKAKLIFDSSNNSTKRAFALQDGANVATTTLNLQKEKFKCEKVTGYIKPNIRDKTSPVDISLEFELDGSNIPAGEVLPILNQLAAPIDPLRVELEKSCTQCNPDLKIDVSTGTEHYILGTDGKIDLNIEMSNSGEDSYLTSLNITLPDGVSYVNVVPTGEQCIPIACTQINVNGTGLNYVSCEVGNPFPQDHTMQFTITVRLEDFHNIDDTELLFTFNTESSFSADTNKADNSFSLAIPLKVETSIFVNGNSNPPDAITYNNSHINAASKRGPLVEHKYEIFTNGPSAIDVADVRISWPLYVTPDMDEYLLYIYKDLEITQSSVDTQVRCNIPERYINPQNVSMSGLTVTKVENPGTGYINRYKRSTAAAVSSSTASVQIGCADDDLTTQCITMQCQIRTFRQSDTVTIKVRALLWMSSELKNLTDDYTKEAVISSSATATVLDVPYQIKPETQSKSSFSVMSYFEKYRPTKVNEPLQWKWIAIGVGCGLILLILIIIILWRCGFFKRYRPYAEAKIEKHKDGQPHEVERLYSGYK